MGHASTGPRCVSQHQNWAQILLMGVIQPPRSTAVLILSQSCGEGPDAAHSE
jgi:hypothetical protein